jgi:transposase InsO family protein
MPYTTNPNMGRIRRDAVRLVKYRGWSTRKVSRYTGFNQSAIVKWCKRDPTGGWRMIETKSSKPKHHPKQLSEEVVRKIVEIRLRNNRTSEVVHQELLNQGIKVSLNSVRRTIDRHGLMKKRSPWKRYHPHQDRPYPLKSGDLVELDTIHRMIDKKKRLYVFVLIDVFSRWVYAKGYEKMNAKTSVGFVLEAQREANFHFNMLQSDHGPEFGKWFVERVKKSHRYSRIGKPNDNAHIERFNRTLQEECLDKVPNNIKDINCALKKYLQYYNHERLHMGISLKAPIQLITKRFQAIG